MKPIPVLVSISPALVHWVFLLVLMVICSKAAGQNCPANIGFEKGTLDHWDIKTGLLDSSGNFTPLNANLVSAVVNDSSSTEWDYYGDFPVTSPNGSGHAIMLGNAFPGGQLDQVSYTFQVPANDPYYTIIFNYAVVLENPGHGQNEQPRFTVKVYNLDRNQYIQCSSFDFVAGFSQPDFIQSLQKSTVFYKPWSSASINLGEFKGERLRLEFSVNDCTLGAHFGYAYLDVMERCTSGLTGYILCKGDNQTTLKGPSGFAGYEWYTGDYSTHPGWLPLHNIYPVV